jgi:hypothetical protein
MLCVAVATSEHAVQYPACNVFGSAMAAPHGAALKHSIWKTELGLSSPPTEPDQAERREN